MTWNDLLGLISTTALTMPILVLFFTRLASYRTFPFLVAYYAAAIVCNMLAQGYVHASPDVRKTISIVNNFLDTPLMLLFLSYFGASLKGRRQMHQLVAAFVAFELLIIGIFGVSVKSVTLIMGPGIALTLAFCVPFFVRQVKITIVHHKASGKALMIASLLFAYGCFSIIYLMYYVMDIQDRQDTFIVYFLVSTFSSLLMSTGILAEKSRVRKLSELKIVRRELSEIYSHEKTAIPYRQAVLDFDKDFLG